ncbi:hypothetical protein [Cupriavidus consociatus]|uniref:hypothetical protein n=1 Tax=Cupriavidus consociatus TaxID=2821357 RepID=UPI001FD80E1C|nr:MULTISPECIES: hypothetical protein [unclassified Cupriavidus]MDK2660849.1 hypothetical protein [Cupriavidus sp. LEh21]
MSDLDRQLHRDAVELCQTGPATPDKLVALAHAALKAWAKVGNLQFPPEKRYALLQEIMRYCAWECLLACCFTQADRLERIADMLDAAYPRYACTRARLAARRNRYGRPRF